MGDPPQACLDAADHHVHTGIGLAYPLRVHHHRPVGSAVGLGIGGIGVVRADLSIGGVAVDHRIHVARRHAKIEPWPAQRPESFSRCPVRLADDADPKSLRLQQPPYQCHAEAGVIDVGVAGDEDHIACIPAQCVHFGSRHRQEGSGLDRGSGARSDQGRRQIHGVIISDHRSQLLAFYRIRP